MTSTDAAISSRTPTRSLKTEMALNPWMARSVNRIFELPRSRWARCVGTMSIGNRDAKTDAA